MRSSGMAKTEVHHIRSYPTGVPVSKNRITEWLGTGAGIRRARACRKMDAVAVKYDWLSWAAIILGNHVRKPKKKIRGSMLGYACLNNLEQECA